MIKESQIGRFIWISIFTYVILVVTTVTKVYERYALSATIEDPIDLWRITQSASMLWGLFFLFLPLINYTIQKFKFVEFDVSRLKTYKNLSIHILFSILVAVLHAAFYIICLSYLRGFSILPFDDRFIRLINNNLAFYTVIDIFIYLCILASYYLYKYYNEIRITQMRSFDLESQLSIVRLEALKMQIQPHFVFNTLHNINALLHENVEFAKINLIRLKNLMQLSVENLDKQLISLNEELQFIEAYLGIEQTRFADRLKVYYEIDENAKHAVVPSMVLQPVIENAIKHGISKSIAFGIIKIKAEIQNNKLLITVDDNGPGLKSDEVSPKFGIGIMNTMNRLDILFDHHEFRMIKSKLGGVQVEIVLPFVKSKG